MGYMGTIADGNWHNNVETRNYVSNPTNAPIWLYEHAGRTWSFTWQNIISANQHIGGEVKDVTGTGSISLVGAAPTGNEANIAVWGSKLFVFRGSPSSSATFKVDKYDLPSGTRTADVYQVNFGISTNPSDVEIQVMRAPWGNKIYVLASMYGATSGTRYEIRVGEWNADAETMSWDYTENGTSGLLVNPFGIGADDTHVFFSYSVGTTFYRRRINLGGGGLTTAYSGANSLTEIPDRRWVSSYGLWAGDPVNDQTVRDWTKTNNWDLDLASGSGLMTLYLLTTAETSGAPYDALAVYASGKVFHVVLSGSSAVSSTEIGDVGAITPTSFSTESIGMSQVQNIGLDISPATIAVGGETKAIRLDFRKTGIA